MSTREMMDDAWDGMMSPTSLQLAKLLKGLNDGENPLPAFVHKANAYAAAPQDLVKGRQCAPGTPHGAQGSCYFYSDPAPVKQGRRTRKVPGGSWHSEKTESWNFVEKEMHLSCLAYRRTFSYIVKSPPGMKRHRGRQRTGWIMVEISLDEHGDGANNMVLCVVHKSTHNYPGTSLAARSSAVQEAAPERDDETSVHQSLGLKCAAAPVQAADKAARTTDKCALHRSGSLSNLEELQHDDIIKELTANEREGIVYCGEDMSSTISEAYLNVPGRKFQQELNDLEDAAAAEGVENELPVDTSGSSVKRKADDSEHTEAPPGVRQARVDTDSTSALEETEGATFPAENYPMPDGGDQDWNLNNILGLDDTTNVELTPVTAHNNGGNSARFVAVDMPLVAEEYQQEPIGVDDVFLGDLLFNILDGALVDDEALLAEVSQHQL